MSKDQLMALIAGIIILLVIAYLSIGLVMLAAAL